MRFMSGKEQEKFGCATRHTNDFSSHIPINWIKGIWWHLDHCEMPKEFKERRIEFSLKQYVRLNGNPENVETLRKLLTCEGPGYNGCHQCDHQWAKDGWMSGKSLGYKLRAIAIRKHRISGLIGGE